MTKSTIIFLCLFISCISSPKLKEGIWSGALTPMNHPDMANPITYKVFYEEDNLVIAIVGPDNSQVPTRKTHIEGDTLFFEFNEPEENVLLECALVQNAKGEFAGRCTDDSGKWATFTMKPPE